ncbi:hypothetical protein L3Q82_008775%2C partial [Xyrichtys novacula]|uniref:Uncharacterized protein n=1 Tax=Xyrichtys novacula TaxID=13765 RepID=A0AAV1EIJ1_XYRNO|nr:hypothetical protein L3Q82_008775%2C partial [Xyrichtys novacula]
MESLEQALEETEVNETTSMSANNLIALLFKPKGPFKGLEIYASESKVTLERGDNNSKVNVRLPKELKVDSNNIIVFCMLTWTGTNESSDVLYEDRLVALSVRGKNISGLQERVNITMSLAVGLNETQEPRCVFLDFSTGNFSEDGCHTLWGHGQSHVTCSCDHFTYFGVILVSADLPPEHLEILSYISLIGCSLSLLVLVITVLLFCFKRKVRTDISMKVHINLAFALILLNLHFLPSQQVATLASSGLCLYFGLALHYSLLATFSWTALEGFHLYLLLVRVFNIYIQRYLLKLSLLGWGVPVVIVSVVVAIDREAYGVFPLDSSNPNSTEICYIVNNTVKMVTTVGAFSLVFFFNLIMLGVAIRRVVGLRRNKQSRQIEGDRVKRNTCTLLGITVLLGVPWGLVFFSFGYLTVPGLYAFCILNSLQAIDHRSSGNMMVLFLLVVLLSGLMADEGPKCSAYLCINNPVIELMTELDQPSSLQREMFRLLYIRNSCEDLFAKDLKVKKSFVKVEKEIIHNIMEKTLIKPGGSKLYDMKDLSLNVISINQSELNLTGTNSTIKVEAPQLLLENQSFIPRIWLPMDALQDIPQEKRIITLVSYMRRSHLTLREEEIHSIVLRIELLGDRQLQDLSTPIQMFFRVAELKVKDVSNNTQLLCQYLDEDDLYWKTDGCETDNEDATDIKCSCTHTTPFAVLLVREPVAEIHWKILSYISYIGCGLSAFFTALSLIIHVTSQNHKTDFSISIHVSLSGALFLLNTTFLLTEWGATVRLDWVCVLVAALMHYSLLCCFTWMAIEALHLYLLLIKVFNTHYKRYLLKLSLAGWGVPGVIVAISLAVKDFKQFYGVTQLTMADTNQTNAICWITDDSFFYSLNLVYFTLIFVFNSGILVAVASSICKMKRVVRSRSRPGPGAGQERTWRDPQRFSESCQGGLTVLGLTCLLGTTWGLAFLGSGYVNYPILYLFCILNSMQGFFIFLWVCLSIKKQRRREIEERLSSSALKTSGTKLE